MPDSAGCCNALLRRLQLYLNLNAGREIQAHQGLDGLLAGVEDIDQSLVGSALELLTAVLVLVHSAKDGNNFLLGGQGDGAGNLSAVALGGFYDLCRAGVTRDLVLSLQPNADHLVCHGLFSSLNYVLSLRSVWVRSSCFVRAAVRIIPRHEKWPTEADLILCAAIYATRFESSSAAR